MSSEPIVRAPGGWGGDTPVLDDAEARRRLLEATSRCIIRRGDAKVRMAEVAEEAGVARSTVYRYFASRDELIVGLFMTRMDAAFDTVIAGLAYPDDAEKSLPELVLGPLSYVPGNPLNEALFSPASRDLVMSAELASVPMTEAVYRKFGPLLERWQHDGQLYPDLDLRDAMRWMGLLSVMMLAPPWSEQTDTAKRTFLGTYFVRSLMPVSAT